MKIIVILIYITLSIPFILMCGIAALIIIDSILSYLSFKDVQWATWCGSLAAITAALYTRRIWINNINRNDIREITALHYQTMVKLFEILEIGYIPFGKLCLEKKLKFYYQYLCALKDLNFPSYLGKLDEINLTKDQEISFLSKELKNSVVNISLYLQGFIAEVESLSRFKNYSNKIIIIRQANDLFEKLNKHKEIYQYYYKELKNTINKKTKRI